MTKTKTPPDPVSELRLHLTLHWTSQAEFARAAGVSQVAVTNYLVGRRGLSPRVAAAVARTVASKEARSRLTLERLLGL
jgi:predicted transcriptional regulator